MNLNITKEKYNPFMKRKELVVNIDNPEEPTPSKAQLAELLTKHVGKETDHIDIIDIFPARGLAKSTARVFVWDEKRVKKEAKTEEKPAAQA